MSVFSIKLKTRNGNDINKKETITVYFRMNHKKGLKTKVSYTFRIMTSKGTVDFNKVFELKEGTRILSSEDAMLKILLNLTHLIGKISQKEGIDPDFVMFFSPDLYADKNRAFLFLKDLFFRPSVALSKEETVKVLDKIYEEWDESACKRVNIHKAELDILQQFASTNCMTKFMFIDPGKHPEKYAKSIHVCEMLLDRLNKKPVVNET